MALTKVNSVGIATGISLTGITTTQDAKIGTGITLSPDGHGYYTGIVTATSYRGDVSNCTGVGQTNFIDAESLNVSGISTFGGAISGTTATFSGNITANGNIVGDDSTNISGMNDVIATSLYTSDTIVHRGDDNTKIRFPTADTITAETNGSERLRITSSGIVVIGESSAPTASGLLHLYQASNDSYIYIQRGSGDAASNIGGIIWKNSTNNLGQIVVASADINDSNMAFKTMFSGTLTEAFRVDNNQTFLVNHNTTYGSGKAQIFNTSQYLLDLSSWSADATGPTVDFYKSRNATIGSSTIVQTGDVVGRLRFLGNDGANSRTAAQITAEVDGTPGTNDMPGRLVFSTTADGGSSSTERLRIDSAGAVILSNTFNSNTDISPALVIGSSSFSRPGIVIRGNSTNKGDISWCDNSGSDSSDGVSEGLIRYDHDGDYMCFHAADEERFRILATGYAEFAGASDIRVTFGSQGTAGTNDSNWIRGDGQNLMYNNAGTGGAHKWEVGGSEKMRITGDGSLIVNGTANTFGGTVPLLELQKNSSGTGPKITMYNGEASEAGAECEIQVGHNYREAARIIFGRNNANNWQTSAANASSNIQFHTNNAGTVGEKVRVGAGSGSYFMVGTTNNRVTGSSFNYPTLGIQHTGTGYNSIGINQIRPNLAGILFKGYQQTSGNYYANYMVDSNDQLCGHVLVNTSNQTVSYTNSSDYRLKQDDVPITNGITRVKQLRPIRFKWKSDLSEQDGFFAHEVQAVVPEAVVGEKDAVMDTAEKAGPHTIDANVISPQQLDTRHMVPLLTAALQEAIAKIETLETKVAALESS